MTLSKPVTGTLAIHDLIKQQERVLGKKLVNAMKTESGINTLIQMIADQQAEAMKVAYKQGLEDGVLGAKLIPVKK